MYDHIEIFNFVANLQSGKDLPVGHGGKVCYEDELEEKALHLPQSLLYAIYKFSTSLTLRNAFYTRSKNLITLLNHMNEIVTYATFQCYIASICEQMMEEEREDGNFPTSDIRM